MTLKEKFANAKKKILDNADPILTVTSCLGAVVTSVYALHFAKLLAEEQAAHKEDLDFCAWVVAHARRDNGTPKILKLEEDDLITIKDMPTPEA